MKVQNVFLLYFLSLIGLVACSAIYSWSVFSLADTRIHDARTRIDELEQNLLTNNPK